MITSDRLRELLLAVWGQQSCQNPEHWPDVLARLMKDGGSGENQRASFKPRVDEAVARLAEAYRFGIPIDAPELIWRWFPMLGRDQRIELAALLASEDRTAELETAPDPLALAAAAHGA